MKITLINLNAGRLENTEVDGLMWVEITTPTGRIRIQGEGDYVTVSTADGALAMFARSPNAVEVAAVIDRDTVRFDGLEFVR